MAQTQRPGRRPATKAPAKKAAAMKVAPPAVEEAELTITMVEPEVAERRSRVPGWVNPAIVIVLLLIGATQLMTLGRQEWGGPPHEGLVLGNGVPATLYLPGKDLKSSDIFPEPKPVGQRPALVIMAHGYSSDQQGLSTMARSIARAGYATVTFDFRGHGANRHRFQGNIDEDISTVIDWAETSPYVDPSRIAVLGHSMGAGAALDWSTLDKRVAAVIPVSGGGSPNDVYTPAHVLFVVAQKDPGVIHDSQKAAAQVLRTRAGIDVQSVEISKTDHLSVVSDARTFDAITSFLDKAFGTPTDRLSTGRDDPRRSTALGYALICVVLFGFLGRLVGRSVPPLATTTTPGAWVLLVASVFVTLPLMATGGFGILPVGAGQQSAVAFLFAAAVLWGTRYFARQGAITGPVTSWVGDGDWLPLRSVWLPGVLAGLAMFVLLAPAGVIIHATVPNTERAIYWVILTAAMVPFFAAFEAIVRRGNTWASLGLGLLGRFVLLLGLEVGLGLGVLPFVLGLVVPLLAIQYVVIEVFAAGVWSRTQNAAVIAIAESVFIAWIAVMFSPIS
jgi:dienelactone hydrolase